MAADLPSAIIERFDSTPELVSQFGHTPYTPKRFHAFKANQSTAYPYFLFVNSAGRTDHYASGGGAETTYYDFHVYDTDGARCARLDNLLRTTFKTWPPVTTDSGTIQICRDTFHKFFVDGGTEQVDGANGSAPIYHAVRTFKIVMLRAD